MRGFQLSAIRDANLKPFSSLRSGHLTLRICAILCHGLRLSVSDDLFRHQLVPGRGYVLIGIRERVLIDFRGGVRVPVSQALRYVRDGHAGSEQGGGVRVT